MLTKSGLRMKSYIAPPESRAELPLNVQFFIRNSPLPSGYLPFCKGPPELHIPPLLGALLFRTVQFVSVVLPQDWASMPPPLKAEAVLLLITQSIRSRTPYPPQLEIPPPPSPDELPVTVQRRSVN